MIFKIIIAVFIVAIKFIVIFFALALCRAAGNADIKMGIKEDFNENKFKGE